MLLNHYQTDFTEAGLDEAGRGCLAGPVFAAAVIFPYGYSNPLVNDSKQLSSKKRFELRKIIESSALAWAVEQTDNLYIDEHNIHINHHLAVYHKQNTCMKNHYL